MYILNGGLYLRAKCFIPFAPLIGYLIALFINDIINNKIDIKKFIIYILFVCILLYYFNQKQYSGRLSVFLNDFMENKRNLPEKEIQLYAELLQQTIEIANKMTYSIEIRNNRNL